MNEQMPQGKTEHNAVWVEMEKGQVASVSSNVEEQVVFLLKNCESC